MAKFVPTDPTDLTKADASPTKAFFVDIITKDIAVDAAILDLVDNCVDGAKRLRDPGNQDYQGLTVSITVNSTEFKIEDNCGGIPLETARSYAFKFGRAPGFIKTSHSVGQFGVGMKRALFKMAKVFSVSSTEQNYKYHIDVNVPIWAGDDINWDFDILDLTPGPFEQDSTGTTLHISELDPEVSETLGQLIFAKSLIRDIRTKHQDPMRRGLAIMVNGETIIPGDLDLKQGAIVNASSSRFPIAVGTSTISVRLYAGVDVSDRRAAGWYIFCNGRNILAADQSSVTGWSNMAEGGVSIPKYHGQFARFRGYAFLDCDDASVLPWNTTKTGLDPETTAYRKLLPRLVEATRPVIDFLNALDAENDLNEPERVLTIGLNATPSMSLERIPARETFLYREPPERGPPMSTIKYRRLTSEVNLLKDAMGAANYPELGELSFKFAFDNLVEED